MLLDCKRFKNMSVVQFNKIAMLIFQEPYEAIVKLYFLLFDLLAR